MIKPWVFEFVPELGSPSTEPDPRDVATLFARYLDLWTRDEALGFEGMLSPMKLSCANHEGPGKAAIQQWDAPGKRWRLVSGFYEPDRQFIAPLLQAESERYATENGISIRECP